MSIFTRAKFARAKALWASRPAAYIVTASVLSAVSLTAADADMMSVGGCYGGSGAFNCVVRYGPGVDPYVRTVPQPENDADKERAASRDRKWIERCHPTIVQDRYGVPRYRYVAERCEFGVIE